MLENLKFSLRRNVWGRIPLRKTLPVTSAPEGQGAGEQAFYAMVLERGLTHGQRERAQVVLDVGCRNWSYARALAAGFPKARLVGFEVDGGRRYWNLHRRIDVAEAHAIELLRHGRLAQCVHADFTDVDLESWIDDWETAAFCFFFPFVSERPCRKWGLPPHFARFQLLLEHVHRGGLQGRASILSCHQGSWEAEITRQAYSDAGLEIMRENVITPAEFAGLWPSAHDVHVFSSVLR